MNLRNALIALVVLAVLVVVLFIVFREPPAPEMNASFPDIAKDHVTKVWIRSPATQTPEEKQEGKPLVFEETTLEREGEGLAARILVHSQQSRRAAPLFVELAHQVPGRLGGDHTHVYVRWRNDLVEPDIETVGKHERVPSLQSRRYLLPVKLRLDVVRHQNPDHVRPGTCLGD